jgi:CRISPR-associated protein Cmr4
VPMRTMSSQGRDVFTWVSCPSLLRDHALISRQPSVDFPDHPVGDRAGAYMVADAQIKVEALNDAQKKAIAFAGQWHENLRDAVQPTWERSRIILPDGDFQVLMEHSLWTQIRNKIQEEAGSAEIFWTDVCIPRDTVFYYAWGYNLIPNNSVTISDHQMMSDILQGLLQVGGQANVGRGWVQSWINQQEAPQVRNGQAATVGVQ